MGGSSVSLDAVVIPLVEGPRILDVGCGFGRWGYLCMTNYWETHSPVPAGRPETVGIDGYLPNVEMAGANGCYRECIHASFPPLPFEDSSFDTVLMVELIEHLQDDRGLELIAEAKRVARRRVVISTPNFPDFRLAHPTITGLNELDGHLSYWSRSRLRKLGFQIYGTGWIRGSRYLRGGLRRVGLLSWFDGRLRPALSSLSLAMPVAAENTVGLWTKR